MVKKSMGLMAELRTAHRLGTTPHPGSGALQTLKADMTMGEGFLVENKATEARRFSVRHDWLAKVADEAHDAAKHPALAFQFVTGDARPIRHGTWVAIPEDLFVRMAKALDGVDY